MKQTTIICAALAFLGTAAVLWQQQSLARLSGNPNRGFTNDVPAATETTNAALEQEIISLREHTKDLARLRNEVGRLRTTRTELAAARTESARLLQAKENAAVPRSAPQGFTSRQQLANVGFATPEAALQTFFWALVHGDIEYAMQAMSPNSSERKQFEKIPADERAALISNTKRNGAEEFAGFNDVGVHRREDVSEDAVVLHVGSSLATNTLRLKLQRFGTEWRVQDFP
jgi:hypothetical protein